MSSAAGGQASPREVISAILTEALPADEESRTFTVVYTAYLALSLTDPALAIAPLVKNSDAVIDVVAAQLRTAQAAGDVPVQLDADLEAVSLTAMSAGLGTSVIAGRSSVEQAQAVIDYHLHRLFPASPPALPRGPAQRSAVPRPEDGAVTTGGRDRRPLPTSPPAAAGTGEKPTAIARTIEVNHPEIPFSSPVRARRNSSGLSRPLLRSCHLT